MDIETDRLRLLAKFSHVWSDAAQRREKRLLSTNLLVDPDDRESAGETDLGRSEDPRSLPLPPGASASSAGAAPRPAAAGRSSARPAEDKGRD